MKNEDILKKAIEKAVKNGFKTDWYRNGVFTTDEQYGQIWTHREGIHQVIFSHDFAKAFWGDADFRTINDEYGNRKVWQHHLMLMVISEDPIQYLKEFI